jgi:hypothetical protein
MAMKQNTPDPQTLRDVLGKESMDGSVSIVCQPFIHILFQRGPINEVGVNGCRIEDVIEVLQAKIEDHQTRKLACEENATALRYLTLARDALLTRRGRRIEQGVLNTKTPHQSADRE